MRQITLTAFFLFFLGNAFSQSWSWTQILTDSVINHYSSVPFSNIIGTSATSTDGQENIYTAGMATFYGQPTEQNCIRLAKYTKFGALIWSKYFRDPTFLNNGSFPEVVYDMKTDAAGNIYMIMRSFSSFDGNTIPNMNTVNCMVKLNTQGALNWIRPVGLIENSAAAPQYCRLTMSPQADHFYVYFHNLTSPMIFLDSSYTHANSSRMLLVRIDSSGHIQNTLKIDGGSPTAVLAALDVNSQDEVLISGSGIENITIADTTILIANGNPLHKNFYTVIRGNDFSRKWTKVSSFYTNNAILGCDVIGGKFSPSGQLGFAIDMSRSSNDNVVDKRFLWGSDTVNFSTPYIYENPFIAITNESGEIHAFKPMSPETRMIVRGNTFAADKANNFYLAGTKKVATVGTSDRWAPVIAQADLDGNRVWQYVVPGLDSLYTIIPNVQGGLNSVLMSMNIHDPVSNVIFGPDTINVPCPGCYTETLTSINGSQSNTVRGKLYLDLNSNNVFDVGDRPVNNSMITANNGEYITFTDTSGDYVLRCDSGNVSVKPAANVLFYNTNPQQYDLNFTGFGTTETGKDFALLPNANVKDVSVDISAVSAVRPGQIALLQLSFSNNASTAIDGNYSLKLPADVSFVASGNAPVSATADSLVWAYNNLLPGDTRSDLVQVYIPATIPINTGKIFKAFIDPYLTDTIKWNNYDSLFAIVTGSFDPNDKQVSPLTPILIDSVQSGKSLLEYVIRFQNTGNDTAFNVFITDTLSRNLDFTTFKLITSSHPVQLKWLEPDVARFDFNNILLPDSGRNEVKSHGFVKFSIAPKSSLQLSDNIFNSAAIYFDNNAAVITNETVTTFRQLPPTVINVQPDSYAIAITPNPIGSDRIIRYSICCFDDEEPFTVTLVDEMGRKMHVQTIQPTGNTLNGTINAAAFSNGVYTLTIRGNKGRKSVRVVRL